ncbi:CgeB family protein [Clostridium magnum]|uniref:Spore protein YkvP n=1 Tax=Clostridium magnum DSM 2767 TaxID=1121326 RepID=A0A161XGF3_9CLOT|nr:glycosyltransferase [Clostridium magnum]KZL93676.1 spore protein YkvP [Clostridium magnum DSM 2767]SHI92618.1 Spore maturation protein CgeB [Clostridium magnum DSM 2767]
MCNEDKCKDVSDKQIDTKEYNYTIVEDISINSNNVFIKKSNLLQIKNDNKSLLVTSSLSNKQFQYISYIEPNVVFSIRPSKKIFTLSNDYNYKVQFSGEKDESILVSMCIVFYSEKEKINLEFINLNEEKVITPSSDAKFYRLGIRIEGKGKCNLKNIKIYKEKQIDFMNFSDLRKLGFDSPASTEDLKIACIFDEFTMECYKPMCRLITFTPYNWKAVFSIDKPHILMVESAWKGIEGSWNRKVGYYNEENIKELKEMTEWCKSNCVPTVFWNKEDPVHFDRFIETCKYFDYIFTTEKSCIDEYKKFLKHDRVYFLPFAAQPKIHNPIKIAENRENKICYAGSYHASKFKERQEDFDRLFTAASKYGIDIYDRNFINNDPGFKFPEKYVPFIKGYLKADEIEKAYKGYKVFINVTSAKNALSMFSRRVFEIIASYTPIVSSYSTGIKDIFGDIVAASDDANELSKCFNLLMNDEEYYNRIALSGLRLVLKKHTYEERLNYILNIANINIECSGPIISVISIIRSLKELTVILDQFKYQSYNNKELILLIDNFDDIESLSDKYIDKNVKVLSLNSLNKSLPVIDIVNGDYISYFSYNNYYGRYFLEDLILAKKYADASIVGKKSYYKLEKKSNLIDELKLENKGQEFEYVDNLDYDSCIINKNIFKFKKIEDLISESLNNHMIKNCFKFGYRLFSIDKYNFVSNYDHNLKNKEILKQIEF